MFYEYRLQEIKANRKRVFGSTIYSRQDVARDEAEAAGCRSRISGGSFNRDNCQTLFILLAAAVRWHKLERVNKQHARATTTTTTTTTMTTTTTTTTTMTMEADGCQGRGPATEPCVN